VTTKTSENVEQINLQSFGFSSFPGIASIVGPFSVFDTRATASQPILDLQALGKTRAAGAGNQAATLSYQDAREIVVWVVANLYYRANAAAGRVAAARSEFQTAEALFHQAEDFKAAGTIPAIELLRAQVEMQAQQQRLIYLENELEKERLDLARAIGLPDGQRFRLTDPLSETVPAPTALAEALQQATASRKDLQSIQAQVRQAQLEEQAAKAERLPKLTADGDYGAIGLGPGVSHGTFSAGASLEFPLFTGGRIHGEVLKADAQLEQRKAELANLRQRIEYELRVALMDLESARQQVAVAKSARELATEQMAQAQDRFSAGVVNNIEVVQAQDALAAANENYISSLFSLNTASASLARAMGSGENGTPAAPQGESK
jgi:outer membrane protein TolC